LWPTELTAWGTLAVAVAAVAVALFAEWRASVRVRDERQHSDKILANERELADKRLADEQDRHDEEIAEERRLADERLRTQMAHSDEQLFQERQAADMRVLLERDRAWEQERLAEAWSVEIVAGRMPPEPGITSEPGQPIGRPVVVVINHGRYTITQVDARFSPDGKSIVGRSQTEASWDVSRLPPDLANSLDGPIGQAYLGVLTPGTGMRFLGDTLLVSVLRSTFPLVRWTDRSGTRWEHKQGDVRQLREDEDWTP
jgi:hypothetical protein